MLKVNNLITIINFEHISHIFFVSIVDLEQVNAILVIETPGNVNWHHLRVFIVQIQQT